MSWACTGRLYLTISVLQGLAWSKTGTTCHYVPVGRAGGGSMPRPIRGFSANASSDSLDAAIFSRLLCVWQLLWSNVQRAKNGRLPQKLQRKNLNASDILTPLCVSKVNVFTTCRLNFWQPAKIRLFGVLLAAISVADIRPTYQWEPVHHVTCTCRSGRFTSLQLSRR